jgi:polysaccharide biosynthesis transport protein
MAHVTRSASDGDISARILEASAQPSSVSPLAHYLRVLRRRAWIVVLVTALGAGAAVFLSLRQQRLYEASADVFLTSQNLAATLSNVQLPSSDPARVAETQADLARTPVVAATALRRIGLEGRSVDDFLRSSSVTTASNADLLTLTVTDPDRRLASRLATAYARAYTDYRRQLDTSSLVRARRELEQRIAELKAAGRGGSALYANLLEKDQQLRTMELLQGSNALLVRSAGSAEQIQPNPVRNGILGGILGFVLGIGLVFLVEALNTRVRTAAEVQERLDLPLLGRLPEPQRKVRRKDQLVMLADPHGPQAEAFRILATNLEFVNLDRGARTLMVTSAGRGEGKSTTAANLAVAVARAGRRVIIVDLDLRLPSVERFFGLEHLPGLTDVVRGRFRLEHALVSIPIIDMDRSDQSGNGAARGLLEALPTGALPPNPSEFMRFHGFSELLTALESRADAVIVDAPPLLGLSDAVALTQKVDALLVVAKLSEMRRPVLAELGRVLEAAPVVKLGFVVTGTAPEDAYGYAYGYQYGYRRKSAAKRRKELIG